MYLIENMNKFYLCKKQTFNNLKEWNAFNERITGINILEKSKEDIKKNYVVVTIYCNSVKYIKKASMPLIQIKNVLYYDSARIVYYYYNIKKNKIELKRKLYANNIIILPKQDLSLVNQISSALFSYFIKMKKKVRELEKKKEDYIREEMNKFRKKIIEEADKKFEWKNELKSIEELMDKDDQFNYNYYCAQCNEYLQFKEETIKCPVCKKFLIDLKKQQIEKDYK